MRYINQHTSLRLLQSIAILSGLVTAHVGVRVIPIGEIFLKGLSRPLLAGSDSYYHAHRTSLQFADFPKARFFDPFMAHPNGAVAEWSLGFDYLWAAVFSVAKLFGATWERLVWALPFCSIALSLAALAVFYRLALIYLPASLTRLACLCFCLNLAFVGVSAVADFDHHVVEMVGVPLLMLTPHVLAKARSRLATASLALGLCLAIWCSTFLANLAVMFHALWLTLRVFSRREPESPHFTTYAVVLSLGLVIISTIEAIGHRSFFSFTTMSLFHAAVLPLLCSGLVVANRVRPLYLAIVYCVAVVGVLAVYRGAMLFVVNYLAGWDDFISNMVESRPIFLTRRGFSVDYMHLYFGVLYALFPFLFLALRRRNIESESGGSMIPVNLWFSLVLLLMSLSQKRFAHLAVPGFIIMVFVFIAPLAGRRKLAFGVLMTALLIEPLAYFGTDGLPSVSRYGRLAAIFADDIPPSTEVHPKGIMTSPNFGSAFVYFTGRPIVSNTFYYKRYLQADLELRRITSDAALKEFLHRKKIAYLVAADDVRYRTMLLRLFGRDDEADRFSQHHFSPCGAVYLHFAYDRLACGNTRIDGLTLIRSKFMYRDPDALMRRVTLYKVN